LSLKRHFVVHLVTIAAASLKRQDPSLLTQLSYKINTMAEAWKICRHL